MNIREATEKGITRLTKTGWTGYGRIHLVDGGHGPWFRIYDRGIQEVIGVETPQAVLTMQIPDNDFIEYTGEPDRDDK